MKGKGLIRRSWIRVSTLGLLAFAIVVIFCTNRMPTIKADGGTFIPTGVRITPQAAPGSLFQPLNPGLASDPAFTVGSL